MAAGGASPLDQSPDEAYPTKVVAGHGGQAMPDAWHT
jgi:hypothetical protein